MAFNGAYVNVGESIWYGPNEWNYVMDTISETENYRTTILKRGDNNITWEDLSKLEESNGGQSISLPSAVFYDKSDLVADRVVNNRVVYDYARTTSPFEYKFHILKQYQAMKKNGDDLKALLDTAKAVYSQSPTADNKTTMEEAQEAYDDCMYVEASNKLNPATMLPPLLDIDSSTTNQNTLETLWKRYDPLSFKPASKNALSWSSSPNVAFSQRNPLVTFEAYGKTYNNLEAGVDCGGIIYISEAYHGTNYIRRASGNISAADANRLNSYHTIEGYTYIDFTLPSNNLEFIMRSSEFNSATGQKSNNVKRVVPGDVIYYYKNTSPRKGYHVMLIHDISILNGNRDIDLSDIEIIESTHNNSEGIKIFGVANTNNLSNYDDRMWFVGRVKIK